MKKYPSHVIAVIEGRFLSYNVQSTPLACGFWSCSEVKAGQMNLSLELDLLDMPEIYSWHIVNFLNTKTLSSPRNTFLCRCLLWDFPRTRLLRQAAPVHKKCDRALRRPITPNHRTRRRALHSGPNYCHQKNDPNHFLDLLFINHVNNLVNRIERLTNQYRIVLTSRLSVYFSSFPENSFQHSSCSLRSIALSPTFFCCFSKFFLSLPSVSWMKYMIWGKLWFTGTPLCRSRRF